MLRRSLVTDAWRRAGESCGGVAVHCSLYPHPTPSAGLSPTHAPPHATWHRDKELAKFEAFLNNQECREIKALVRGRQPLAYPIYG